jgi:Raf kinase inhibitor-like YbhB/YbcL family protein
MGMWSNSFNRDGVIPQEFAFCMMDPANHVKFSANRNPHIGWYQLPPETKSFVLICRDTEVPSRGDDVSREGKTVPANLSRVDFFHWILVDIPPHIRAIEAGACSDGVTARGKADPFITSGPLVGARQGLNDYTGWFAGDADMAGEYFGYDGPCPPWNDERVHEYKFSLYALDVARTPVEGKFTGRQVLNAIHTHVLDKLVMTGIYTLNPSVAKALDSLPGRK